MRALLGLVLSSLLLGVGAQWSVASERSPGNPRVKPLVVTGLAWQQNPVIGFGDIFTQVVWTARNPNRRHMAVYPVFRVTARDANGRVLYSDTATLDEAPPMGQLGWATQLPTQALPSTVEVTFVEARWLRSKPPASAYKEFKFSGVSVQGADPGDLIVTGEVGNPYRVRIGEVYAVFVFRDAQGTIVGGGDKYIEGLTPGALIPFSSDSNWTNAPIASVSILAQPRAFGLMENFARTGKLRPS